MPHSAHSLSLPAVDIQSADAAQRALLDQALRQVGFIPNMYARMAHVPALLETYLHGYGLFRKTSGFRPAEQEVVFLAISMANGCDYCAAAHSMMAEKVSKVSPEVLQAIRNHEAVPDPRLSALHALCTDMVTTQGRPRAEVVQAFLNAGFEQQHLLWVILAIGVKTLSNFSNQAFGTPLDERFAGHAMQRS